VGDALGEDALRKALYDALSEAGNDRKAFPAGEGFRFHDLRHTYGTLAVQVYPVADVKAYMGHAQLATTELYAHHVPKHNAAVALTDSSTLSERPQKPGPEPGPETPRTKSDNQPPQARIRCLRFQAPRLGRNS
jgi:hypothetical protein